MKAATARIAVAVTLPAISIHAAREGGDKSEMERLILDAISIHAAREGGDFLDVLDILFRQISIHAAREGGDAITQLPRIYRSKFQSTPPVKAATSDSA